MSREMDRLAGTMWPDVENGGLLAMPTEVVETGDEVRFEVEMPGFRMEDLDITLENNVLTIAGEKKDEREETRKDSDYRLFERRYGRYQRSFTVPPTVRGDQCEAHYENGVLSVRLPKSEDAKPRRIKVQATNGESGRRIENQQG
jgi:HSP20 family protein